MTSNEFDSRLPSMSLSSKSEGTLLTRRMYKNPALHERCTMLDMLKLREIFHSAHMGRLLPTEFREVLRDVLNAEYDEEEFKLLFLKINAARTGEIDWDELVSHLLLGYFTSDGDHGGLQPPIAGLPRVLRSRHRHAVARVLFCPDVGKDRSTDPMLGSYVTASRDGVINWWSLNMKLLRSAQSTCPHLKVQTTWVTDVACLPDVDVLVTSSTERDLRFYDCTAGTFTLKIVITSWDYMICTLHYSFSADISSDCMLVCGDAGGHVRVLRFCPEGRGPFRNRPGRALVTVRHRELQKKNTPIPEFRLVEFLNLHSDWVRQVAVYRALSCLVSCATCPEALLLSDLHGKTRTVFRVDRGIHCFTFDEDRHMLVTGGPDCCVRVWSAFVPARPSLVLAGHHAAVTTVVLQDSCSKIYSLATDRVIKVWDVQAQVCLQTYIDIPALLGERTPISAVYHDGTRDLVLAAVSLAVVTLDEKLNPEHTDGFTHSRAVSKVLYNPLFKVIITCSHESVIICWDPLTGKRNATVRNAHTHAVHGEEVPVEVTAACFDHGYQLLLTGARNGTLKVWNFNTGVCLRNMSIEHMCEVTAVFWVEGRILAVGWNRHVTEFEDCGAAAAGKAWELRHEDDVLCGAARPPAALATASYSSELVLWKLDTGQPYRRYLCSDPTLRIKMHYSKKDLSRPSSPTAAAACAKQLMGFRACQKSKIDMAAAIAKAKARRSSGVAPLPPARHMRPLAAHAMTFLQTRECAVDVASLMVSIENGEVQCWSDHPAGGFKESFQAVHIAGDYVSALTTDAADDYLFCGTTAGYVKVWLMKNFLRGEEPVHVNMPALRLEFPFLWRDRVEGRAKRRVRDQPLPLLLNSYRAHLRCITSMAYVDEHKLLYTGSADYSVRVWRLSGEYLGTLGGLVPWSLDETRVPPDVRKVASSTTLKVWQHGEVSRYTPGQVEEDKLRDITELELRTKTYGAAPSEPVLGAHYRLPPRPEPQPRIVLNDELPTIPIYCHLRMASTQPIKRPPTPPLVKETRLKRVTIKKTHFQRPSQVARTSEPRPELGDQSRDRSSNDRGSQALQESSRKLQSTASSRRGVNYDD